MSTFQPYDHNLSTSFEDGSQALIDQYEHDGFGSVHVVDIVAGGTDGDYCAHFYGGSSTWNLNPRITWWWPAYWSHLTISFDFRIPEEQPDESPTEYDIFCEVWGIGELVYSLETDKVFIPDSWWEPVWEMDRTDNWVHFEYDINTVTNIVTVKIDNTEVYSGYPIWQMVPEGEEPDPFYNSWYEGEFWFGSNFNVLVNFYIDNVVVNTHPLESIFWSEDFVNYNSAEYGYSSYTMTRPDIVTESEETFARFYGTTTPVLSKTFPICYANTVKWTWRFPTQPTLSDNIAVGNIDSLVYGGFFDFFKFHYNHTTDEVELVDGIFHRIEEGRIVETPSYLAPETIHWARPTEWDEMEVRWSYPRDRVSIYRNGNRVGTYTLDIDQETEWYFWFGSWTHEDLSVPFELGSIQVDNIPYPGEMYLGSYIVPMPTKIEGSIGGSLKEFDLVENIREITARPGYYHIYKIKWDIVDTTVLGTLGNAREQTMPVVIADNVGIFDFNGFITDYSEKTVQDVPPKYEVSATIEGEVE